MNIDATIIVLMTPALEATMPSDVRVATEYDQETLVVGDDINHQIHGIVSVVCGPATSIREWFDAAGSVWMATNPMMGWKCYEAECQ